MELTVEGAGVALPGTLTMPDRAAGVVLFAHGSGSSRLSPRNQAVAGRLNAAGFGTLLFDLLTADEERLDSRTGELRFDVALLAGRLIAAIERSSGWPCWRNAGSPAGSCPVGRFELILIGGSVLAGRA